MKKAIIKNRCLSAVLVFMAMLVCACKPEPITPEPTLPDNIVKDLDGNMYKTVKIGTQTWMSEDLKVQHLPNGVDLEPFGIRVQLPSYVSYMGRILYNSKAARFGAGSPTSYVQGICPDGWHLPSLSEWRQLTEYVTSHPESWDSSGTVSRALASQGWLWGSDETASYNQTGFSALPTGYFISYGRHTEVYDQRWAQRERAYYWSADHNDYYPRPSTQDTVQYPWFTPQWGWFGSDSLEVQSFVFLLDVNKEQPEISSLPDIHYCAIRCVKDM